MKNLEKINKEFKDYKNMEREYFKQKRKTLPLCAAENIISDFVRIPLNGEYQERYIMNGLLTYDSTNNFIGSKFLYETYSLIQQQCEKIFSASYSDARTLTGMNCVTSLLMSITEEGDNIMLQTSASGGHPSMEWVCKRLGLNIIDMPYDYEKFDIDYEQTYEVARKKNVKFLLYAPSDIIKCPDYSRLILPDNTVFLYDASQTLGLIAGKVIDNPLTQYSSRNCIVFGGTHKTLPGPANGLILTNSEHWALKIDETISPYYLRHTQMHQVVSLLYTLFEMEQFGQLYAEKIIDFANTLGKELEHRGLHVLKNNDSFSETHQLFIQTTEEMMDKIFLNAFRHDITLNKKSKPLFRNYGIRLGVQEIARLDWESNPIKLIADIILSLTQDDTLTQELLDQLNIPSTINYTFKITEN